MTNFYENNFDEKLLKALNKLNNQNSLTKKRSMETLSTKKL